jgi:RNA polymerase sigma-70 factor (ECF subfamily)
VTAQESAPSDEALALRAQQGDRRAFDVLVTRHKQALYRVVRRYVGNADDAYDILQDALISAWEALNRYDAERPFLAWVRVIVLNKCRDFSRRHRFRRLILDAFAAEPATTAAPGPPEQDDAETLATERTLRLKRLEEAIAALPTLYKEPLVLTTAGRLTQEATAKLLGTTTKAIEMRLRRARSKLIEALNPSRQRDR